MPILTPNPLYTALVGVCLVVASRIRSPKVLERGLFGASLLPWLHVVASYLFAFYVRLGFGAWPRCYVDNPELPLIGGLSMGIALSLLVVLYLLPFVWLGWLVIILRRGLKRFWRPATALFCSGITAMVTSQVADPWRFWEWFWD
jgi:hypothetical protein